MTPEVFQHLVDRLDQRLAGAKISATETPSAENSGTASEEKVLAFAVDAIRFDALHRQVRKALASVRAEKTPVVPMWRRAGAVSMRVAAGLALLLCLAGLGKYVLTTPGSVYDASYTSYEMGTTRGGGDLSLLEQAYQYKNWGLVESEYGKTVSPSAKDAFLAGMAYMEQRQYVPAIHLFKSVQQGASYRDESEYYLAMAYLANHQTAPALDLINKIKADPDHLFHRRVMQMSALDLLILRAK